MSANQVRAPAAAPTLPTQRGPSFTGLVVDNHPLIREAVAVRLHSLGATEVIEAACCAEARARARNLPPDLATIDLRLPDGSGLDLLAELRGTGCPG